MKPIRDVILRCARLGLLAALWLCASPGGAWAAYADVIEGTYENCSAVESGGRIKVAFTVTFKTAAGNTGTGTDQFASRSMAVFFYNENGDRKPPDGTLTATINGVGSGYSEIDPNGRQYLYFLANTNGVAHWTNSGKFTAKFILEFAASEFNKWPAVGIHVGNQTTAPGQYGQYFTRVGVLYVAPKLAGICRVIGLNAGVQLPSPVTTEITVTAPDWDLGELQRGKETTRTLADDAQRLCFRYDPAYMGFDKYWISASNKHGVAANKFLLANTEGGGETIPYTLRLVGGGNQLDLPSTTGLPLTLAKIGPTCLTPTFKATADATLKGTDFSDVLTFTIVTQS